MFKVPVLAALPVLLGLAPQPPSIDAMSRLDQQVRAGKIACVKADPSAGCLMLFRVWYEGKVGYQKIEELYSPFKPILAVYTVTFEDGPSETCSEGEESKVTEGPHFFRRGEALSGPETELFANSFKIERETFRRVAGKICAEVTETADGFVLNFWSEKDSEKVIPLLLTFHDMGDVPNLALGVKSVSFNK